MRIEYSTKPLLLYWFQTHYGLKYLEDDHDVRGFRVFLPYLLLLNLPVAVMLTKEASKYCERFFVPQNDKTLIINSVSNLYSSRKRISLPSNI